MKKDAKLRFTVDKNSATRMDRVIKVNHGFIIDKKIDLDGIHYLINKL